MKQGECFKCKAPVMVEKVGEWPNGKAKWKTYELDGSTVHPHSPTKEGDKGGNNKQTVDLTEINSKLDQILAILQRGQNTFSGNE